MLFRSPKDVRKCVEGCKRKNSDESTEPCSEKCRDKITSDGDMTEFLKDCVHTVFSKPRELDRNYNPTADIDGLPGA